MPIKFKIVIIKVNKLTIQESLCLVGSVKTLYYWCTYYSLSYIEKRNFIKEEKQSTKLLQKKHIETKRLGQVTSHDNLSV